MKVIIFTLIVLMSSVCYGQLPTTSDNIYVLVTDRKEAPLSRQVEGYLRQSNVRDFMKRQRYQFVQYYGQDISKQYHDLWGVTHYPTIVHLQKIQGGYAVKSRVIARSMDDVANILGARPTTPPQVATQQRQAAPQRQYAPPQQRMPQQNIQYQRPQSQGSS